LLKDGKIYFGVGNQKEVYKQMCENPYVEIVALVETDFLRYYGKAVFEETYDFADIIVKGNEFLESIERSTKSKFKTHHGKRPQSSKSVTEGGTKKKKKIKIC